MARDLEQAVRDELTCKHMARMLAVQIGRIDDGAAQVIDALAEGDDQAARNIAELIRSALDGDDTTASGADDAEIGRILRAAVCAYLKPMAEDAADHELAHDRAVNRVRDIPDEHFVSDMKERIAYANELLRRSAA